MKVNFFQRIGVKISFSPMLFLLALYCAGGMGFYYNSPEYFLNGYHCKHLTSIAAEKKQSIDAWFDYTVRGLDTLSKAGIIRDGAAQLASAAPQEEKRKKKTSSRTSSASAAETQKKISALLAETALSSHYHLVLLLSHDGRIIAGNRPEMLGADWSGRESFTNAVAGLKGPTVLGFVGERGGPNGVALMTPINDPEGKPAAVLYAIAAPDELSRYLREPKSIYKSETIELIDKEGALQLNGNGLPDKTTKYNLPKTGRVDGVQLKGNLFYCVTALESAPFKLVSTVGRAEVMMPYETMFALYFAFGGLFFLVMVIQAVMARRLITRPVTQLVSAVEAAADGDLGVDPGEGFSGELLVLKKAVAGMLVGFERKAGDMKTSATGDDDTRMKAALYPRLAAELKGPLDGVMKSVHTVLDRGKNIVEADRKLLEEVSGMSRSLLTLVDGLLDLSQLEQGKTAVTTREFDFCKLLGEVEEHARELIGAHDIGLVAECHESLAGKPICLDRARMKEALFALVSSAVRSTGSGTVTILSSEAVKNGTTYLEISVADTGSGFGKDIAEKVIDDSLSLSLPLGIVTARKLVKAMGGSVTLESASGKGSVFTVMIPMRKIVQ